MFAPPESFELPLAPAIPPKTDIQTYGRFGATFEPDEYSGWIDESMSWKDNCYIGDWSPLGKIVVSGRDALQFFSDISINSFQKFDIGQAKHAVFCNEAGKVMGEGILMRLAEERFLFTSGPGILWAMYMFGKRPYDARLENIGPSRFILQVQGPNALFVTEEAAQESLRDIGFMRFRECHIAGRTLLALRQGMAGEIGFELHGRIEDAVSIYNEILRVGARYDIRRLGARTKMVNHVEACFPTPTVDYMPAMFDADNADFRETFVRTHAPSFLNLVQWSGSYPVDAELAALARSPVELGWGKSIRFDHAFVGAQALEQELAAPRRKIATLEWNDEDVGDIFQSLMRSSTPYKFMEMPRRKLGCMETDRIEKDGVMVGATTSRCYSYYFRKMLSLAVIDVGHLAYGAEVTVIWGDPDGPQKPVRATVCPAPYKTDRRRADLSALPATPLSGG